MADSIDYEISTLENRLLHLKRQARELRCRDASRSPLLEVEAALPLGHIPRFSRQMIVPCFGAGSQEILNQLRVLIIGAGGLGCPSGLYLASAGVGHIGVVDDDDVELSNLHRQLAHPSRRCGWSKAASLVASLAAVSPATSTFEPVRTRFDARTAGPLVQSYHIVVDCSDNPATRYLASDACALARKPLVSGAALGTDGQLSTYLFRGSPCYRCLHPKPPPPATVSSCADAGVLGPITGVIGSMQALEVLKIASDCAAAGLRPRMRRAAAAVSGCASAGVSSEAAGIVDSEGCTARVGSEPESPAEAVFVRCSCDRGSTAHAAGCDMRCSDASCACPPVDVCSAEAFVVSAASTADTRGPGSAGAGGAVAGAGAAAAAPREPAAGFGSALAGRLFVFDGADGRARTVALRPRRVDCAVCAAACTGAAADAGASGVDAAAASTPGSAPAAAGGSIGSIRSLEESDAWLRAHGLIAREGAGAAPAPAVAAAASAGGAATSGMASVTSALSSTAAAAAAVTPRAATAEVACACESKPAFDASAPVPDVSVEDLAEARRQGSSTSGAASGGSASGGPASAQSISPVIVDVRSEEQFSICSLRGSVNIPLSELRRDAASSLRSAGIDINEFKPAKLASESAASEPRHMRDPRVYVLCRRGVDSKTGAVVLRGLGLDAVNVAGGLQAWSSAVDSAFPRY